MVRRLLFEGDADGVTVEDPDAALAVFSERRSQNPVGNPQRPTRVCQLRCAQPSAALSVIPAASYPVCRAYSTFFMVWFRSVDEHLFAFVSPFSTLASCPSSLIHSDPAVRTFFTSSFVHRRSFSD